MDAEPLLCSMCRGRRYPRQCRNSRDWRKMQRAPLTCPFEVPLNHLAVGDNVPQMGTIAPEMGTARARDCAHAMRLTCCKLRCGHAAGKGLIVVNAHCRVENCRFYEARAEEAAHTAHV